MKRSAAQTDAADQADGDERRKKEKTGNGPGYHCVLEEVEHAKQLRDETVYTEDPPRADYTFCPDTFPSVSRLTKSLCRERDEPVYIVANPRDSYGKTYKQGPIAEYIARKGHHFPTKTLNEALTRLNLHLRGKQFFVKKNGDWVRTGVHYQSMRTKKQSDQYKDMLKKHGLSAGGMPKHNESDEIILGIMKDIYPKIPDHVAHKILRHAFREGANKVGTAMNIALNKRVELSVTAHIRHEFTNYDEDLKNGIERPEARRRNQADCLRKTLEWRDEPDTEDIRTDLDEMFREYIVIESSEDEDDRYDKDEDDPDDEDDDDSDDSEASVVFLSSRSVAPQHVFRDYRPARNEQNPHNQTVHAQDRYQRNTNAIRARYSHPDDHESPQAQNMAEHGAAHNAYTPVSIAQEYYENAPMAAGLSVLSHGYGPKIQTGPRTSGRGPPSSRYPDEPKSISRCDPPAPPAPPDWTYQRPPPPPPLPPPGLFKWYANNPTGNRGQDDVMIAKPIRAEPQIRPQTQTQRDTIVDSIEKDVNNAPLSKKELKAEISLSRQVTQRNRDIQLLDRQRFLKDEFNSRAKQAPQQNQERLVFCRRSSQNEPQEHIFPIDSKAAKKHRKGNSVAQPMASVQTYTAPAEPPERISFSSFSMSSSKTPSPGPRRLPSTDILGSGDDDAEPEVPQGRRMLTRETNKPIQRHYEPLYRLPVQMAPGAAPQMPEPLQPDPSRPSLSAVATRRDMANPLYQRHQNWRGYSTSAEYMEYTRRGGR